MRLTIAAVGRLKEDAEQTLVARYIKRLSSARATGLGPLKDIEVPESRAGSSGERKADEAARLLKIAGDADVIVVLDERGKMLSSTDFARFVGRWKDDGRRHAAFLIGGPDGHGDAARHAAHLMLSLSPMTLPHGIARAVLAEQLYRAATILSGHPYHRV
jgi:23S rRNA (pseudouridine1915-N3)-methyltransferase